MTINLSLVSKVLQSALTLVWVRMGGFHPLIVLFTNLQFLSSSFMIVLVKKLVQTLSEHGKYKCFKELQNLYCIYVSSTFKGEILKTSPSTRTVGDVQSQAQVQKTICDETKQKQKR